MRILGLLCIIAVALLGVSFALLNKATVTLNYYLGTIQLPLSLLLVYALIAGALLGVITMLTYHLRLKHQLRRLTKKVKLLEKDLAKLPVKT